MAEPIPVIPLQYEGPTSDHPPIRPLLRNSVVASWLIVFLGTIAIWINDQTAVISGPLLSLTGILTIIAAFKPRHYPAIILGGCHIAVCLTFVILVNAFRWPPADAQTPFSILSTIYTVGSCFYTLTILQVRLVWIRN